MSEPFSPENFLDMTFTDPNSTKTVPCPAGEWLGIVKSVKVRAWKKKDDPSVGGLALDVMWNVEDQSVKDQLGRDEVVVKQGVMLDMTDDGNLDFGKGANVGLGRLREALDMNKPGEPFSFSMMVGRMGRLNVTHRIDGEDIYAEVKSVAKA